MLSAFYYFVFYEETRSQSCMITKRYLFILYGFLCGMAGGIIAALLSFQPYHGFSSAYYDVSLFDSIVLDPVGFLLTSTALFYMGSFGLLGAIFGFYLQPSTITSAPTSADTLPQRWFRYSGSILIIILFPVLTILAGTALLTRMIMNSTHGGLGALAFYFFGIPVLTAYGLLFGIIAGIRISKGKPWRDLLIAYFSFLVLFYVILWLLSFLII